MIHFVPVLGYLKLIWFKLVVKCAPSLPACAGAARHGAHVGRQPGGARGGAGRGGARARGGGRAGPALLRQLVLLQAQESAAHGEGPPDHARPQTMINSPDSPLPHVRCDLYL